MKAKPRAALPIKETKCVIKNLSTKKSPSPDALTSESYQIFKDEIINF